MKRIDDLIQVATRRFGDDAALQQEIACELRAHLEDSLEAARADGMDEARAEESAIRAFGDPEEVGEKLLEANRRRMLWRMGRRASIRLAGLLGLTTGAIFLEEWARDNGFWRSPWGLAECILCLLAIRLTYAFSRRFLPKTALFGATYLLWLQAAFLKSARVIVRHRWIWVPALVGIALTVATDVSNKWSYCERFTASYASRSPASSAQPAIGAAPARIVVQPSPMSLKRPWRPFWDTALSRLEAMRPMSPFGGAMSLLAIAYLLFAARVPRLLQFEGGMSRLGARCWNAAFIVGACASILREVLRWFVFLLPGWRENGAAMVVARISGAIMPFVFIAAFPFDVLVWAIFLTVVIRGVRGAPLSFREIVKSALICIGPLLCLSLISMVFWAPGYLPWMFGGWEASRHSRAAVEVMMSVNLWTMRTRTIFGLVTALIPVIIVSEQCRLGSAFVRLGSFFWRYFWRHVLFIILGAVLLFLPAFLLSVPFGDEPVSLPVYLGFYSVEPAIRLVLRLVLTVMWVEFYLTRAGTVEPGLLKADS